MLSPAWLGIVPIFEPFAVLRLDPRFKAEFARKRPRDGGWSARLNFDD